MGQSGGRRLMRKGGKAKHLWPHSPALRPTAAQETLRIPGLESALTTAV